MRDDLLLIRVARQGIEPTASPLERRAAHEALDEIARRIAERAEKTPIVHAPPAAA